MVAGGLIPAYVIHIRPYRETTPVVEFFTATEGRIPLLARGAHSAKSRRRSLLQPFVPLLFDSVGRGNIRILTHLEAEGQMLSLQGQALFSGFYLNELLLRLLPQHEPATELFSAYQRSLQQLALNTDLDVVLREFELRLLQTLGYGVDLLHEAGSMVRVRAESWYRYEMEHGLVPAAPEDDASIQGDTLHALSEYKLRGQRQRQQAKRLMRRILHHYLGGKPVKSRELFTSINTRNSA